MNGPRARADLFDPAIRGVAHDHAARIARKALGRSRGNVHAILEGRLTRRIGIREYRGFDVDHDLVALSGSARIDSVVQGRSATSASASACCCSIGV